MAVNVFLDPAAMPNRSMDQQTFDNAMAALMQNLPVLASQINSTEAGMNSIAAGGAYAVPYAFKTGQVVSTDPGAGKIGIITAGAQNAATALYVDALNAGGADVTTLLDSMGGSTSAVKGQIRLQKQGDTTKWLTFNVTSVGAPSGYRVYYVTPTGSSAPSPFADTDALVLFFQSTGDRGQTGMYSIAKFSERQAANASAGSSVALGFTTRALNTTDQNDIGASLSSNQITVPAGTYQVIARAPAYGVGSHRAFLLNMTDGVDLLQGANAVSSASTGTQTDSIITGVFTINASKSLALRHWTQNAQSANGLGVGMGYATEIYSEIMLMKIA